MVTVSKQLSSVYILIELHAPTDSIQKLKLMGRVGQLTYTWTV